jgi:hypothetical protein
MATRVEHELGLSFGTWNGIKTAGKAAHFYIVFPSSHSLRLFQQKMASNTAGRFQSRCIANF